MSDTLPDKLSPALSATSDMPDVTEPAVAAEPEPKAIEAEAATEADVETKAVEPTEEATEAEETPEATEAKKPARGVGKALEAQREAIAAEQRRAEAAERRAAELLARVEAAEQRAAEAARQPAVEEKPEPIPERTSYEDPNEFYKALGEWSGRQATRVAKAELASDAAAIKAAADKKAAETQAATQLQTAVMAWNERKAKAAEEMPDYAEVAEADNLAISQTMAETILHADNGPAIAYHLGKNPDEAKRIWNMAPGSQVFEIGRIAAKLAAPKPNVSRAPDPIKPIRASSAPANRKTPEQESMDEYAARRQSELNASRRRPGAAMH